LEAVSGVAVAASSIGGQGVFANMPIAKGDVIHQMGGAEVNLATCIVRIATRQLRIDDPLPVGRFNYIVLDTFSNRFNHSCAPNALLRKTTELFAIRDIAAGEEITFDYSTTLRRMFYSRLWRMPCNCGAPRCRHFISDVTTIPRDRLRHYIQVGGLQAFIRAELGDDVCAAEALMQPS
jgi:uncharacterized protein